MKTGLVSITFRRFSPGEIIALTQRANLDGIEWGGDVHVPHGDLQAARQVLAETRKANLQVACYGSYYRAGVSENDGLSWVQVLATAKTLAAPMIRVWAGNRGTQESDAAYRQTVIDDLGRICELAARENIAVALEFHGGTLTDSGENALQVLAGVQQPNLGCLWQPRVGQAVETRLNDLEWVAPYLSNVHVFQWDEKARVYHWKMAQTNGASTCGRRASTCPLKTSISRFWNLCATIAQSSFCRMRRY